MLVQIKKEEFLREVTKKAWHQTDHIIWTIIFIYPIFSIFYFIFSNGIWQQFFIILIITDILILLLYVFFQYKHYNYRLLLHITFLLLAATSALLCNIVELSQSGVFYLLFASVILFFNLQVFWEPINSVLQLLIAFALLAIFYYCFNPYSLTLVFSNGAELFFIIALVSCFIPGVRYKIIEREVQSKLLIAKSNEQLIEQYNDINEKNNIILSQYERLQKLESEREAYINVAGNDLKKLTATIAASNIKLRDGGTGSLSAEQVELTGGLLEASEKIQILVDKLIDVKDFDPQEVKFHQEVFDINEVAAATFKDLATTAAIKNIHLINNILEGAVNVNLDPMFVGQIFQNLLLNAIKISQADNEIRVVTGLQQQKFIFEIADNGQPVGQEELDIQFNKLKKLSEVADRSKGKHGFGLSIAKLLINEMGGGLLYRSDSNGNYFKVEFTVI
jgi:signal transduction histidine kinase